MKTILAVDEDQNIRLMCERQLYGDHYITWPTPYDNLEGSKSLDANSQLDLIILGIKVAPIEDAGALRWLWNENAEVIEISNLGYSV